MLIKSNNEDVTPLFIACQKECLEIIELLLNYKADLKYFK